MRRSILIALAIALLLAAWLASPYLGLAPRADDAPAEATATERAPPPVKVRVRLFAAEPVTREIALSGRTEAMRSVEVVAETSGRVVALPALKGATVEAGAVLARLDPRDKKAVVAQAQAELDQRSIENNAAERLGQKGFQAETRVAEAKASLEGARAALERARLDLANTEIKAPIGGYVERLPIEVGSYVGEGAPAARIVRLRPLKVVADLPEARALDVEVGGAARVRFPDGGETVGRVTFIGREANEATRTFSVEVEVANEGGRVPAGVSAAVNLDVGEVKAQRLSVALLSLDDEGAIGVKTVDANDRVAFMPVEIVKGGAEEVWVTGLPDPVRLITVGAGFVAPGQRVVPMGGEDGA